MSSMNSSGNANLAAALRRSLHDHWRLLLAEGIILVVLGLAAILVPPLALLVLIGLMAIEGDYTFLTRLASFVR